MERQEFSQRPECEISRPENASEVRKLWDCGEQWLEMTYVESTKDKYPTIEVRDVTYGVLTIVPMQPPTVPEIKLLRNSL